LDALLVQCFVVIRKNIMAGHWWDAVKAEQTYGQGSDSVDTLLIDV